MTPVVKPAEKPYSEASHVFYLLVVGGPYAAGDLTLQVNFRGPVTLAAHRTHQHETITVRDQSLRPIMRPREVTHLRR